MEKNDRISLVDAYDNRSVIEQIRNVGSIAESAEETAEAAKARSIEALGTANLAMSKASEAYGLADNAQRTANEAKDIATDARNVTIHLDHETWTFITEDETTITREVVIYVQ